MYDKDLVAGKLRRWEKFMNRFKLPMWDDIPDFGLYMEQVVVLLKQYLDYLPEEMNDRQQIITSAMINNYVRTKIMPVPVKKKYFRVHIAYLIMICTLKQSMNFADLKNLIPVDIPEEEVKDIYESFAYHHRITTDYFVSQIRQLAGKILDHKDAPEFAAESPKDLITMSAVISGFSGLMANKLLLLEGKSTEGQEIN